MTTVDLLNASCGSIAFIGTGKNVGKTTTMNHFIKEYRGGKLALTSIGRDGESEDLVTGTEKPKIFVSQGTLIATSKGSLSISDISRNILATTGIITPMGEVVICEALSDGFIDLAGPSIGEQIKRIIAILKGFGAEMVFVDGALDRKSMANPLITDGAILCTGAPIASNEAGVIDQTNVMIHCLNLPVSKYYSDCTLSIFGDVDRHVMLPSILHIEIEHLNSICKKTKGVYIKGVLTDAFATQLIGLRHKYDRFELVVEDGTKIFLSMKRIKQLSMSGIDLKVRHKTDLLGISVNPKKLSGEVMDFEKLVAGISGQGLPVFNCMEVIE